MAGEEPPPGAPTDWVYHEQCWCEWCVAYRAAMTGEEPEPFHQMQDPNDAYAPPKPTQHD